MSSAGPGRLSRSASKIVANPANGFHLLRIEGYSHTKTLLPGQKLSSQQFNVGGHAWRIDYYPNGRDASNSNAISVYLQLIDRTHSVKQAQYKFSLLDNAGIPSYELRAETDSFTSDPSVYAHMNAAAGAAQEPGPGCGHDEFITKEELERRRGDLIRDDSIVIRCDVGVTQVVSSFLAHDDVQLEEYDDEEDLQEYPSGYGYGPPGRPPRRQRRVDDDKYVQWCLKQEPAGGSQGRRRGGRY